MNPLAAVAVAATLLADTSAVAPGRPFRLGVKLAVPDGWHVYWSNPGDAARPTTVKLAAPRDASVKPWRFPVPEKFVQPGDLTGYGYTKEVLVWCDVAVAPGATAAAFEFQADVAWMACKDVCVPGRAALRLVLPAGTAAPAHRGLFDAWKDLTPWEASSPECPAQVRWSPRGRSGVVTLKLIWEEGPGGRVTWVAPADPAYVAKDVRPACNRRIARVNLRLEPQPGTHPPAAEVPVLVAYTDGSGAHRGIVLRVPVRGEAP